VCVVLVGRKRNEKIEVGCTMYTFGGGLERCPRGLQKQLESSNRNKPGHDQPRRRRPNRSIMVKNLDGTKQRLVSDFGSQFRVYLLEPHSIRLEIWSRENSPIASANNTAAGRHDGCLRRESASKSLLLRSTSS
jgi:hypothetical protein